MAQYIDKSDVVAEIERRISSLHPKEGQGMVVTKILKDHYKDFLSYLDTLGAKEVDLEEEIDRWQGCEAFPEGVGITPLPKAMEIVERTAKHFFELGVNKAQKGE
jgi:hypothetical protein